MHAHFVVYQHHGGTTPQRAGPLAANRIWSATHSIGKDSNQTTLERHVGTPNATLAAMASPAASRLVTHTHTLSDRTSMTRYSGSALCCPGYIRCRMLPPAFWTVKITHGSHRSNSSPSSPRLGWREPACPGWNDIYCVCSPDGLDPRAQTSTCQPHTLRHLCTTAGLVLDSARPIGTVDCALGQVLTGLSKLAAALAVGVPRFCAGRGAD